MRDSLTIVIGGEAGQGLATAGELASRLLTRTGYNFITYQGYHSRIRGGHNTYALKICQSPLTGPEDQADMVISLDENTDAIDAPRLRPGGLLLAFNEKAAVKANGVSVLEVPFGELGSAREINMIALGLMVSALGLPLAGATDEVNQLFEKKGGSEKPLAALKAAYYWAEPKIGGKYQVSPAVPGHPGRLVITGNDALALGAAAGGVNFCSFYPMSPATTVAVNLTNWAAEAGLVVEQAEDEIAAVNMALGASYGGAVPLVPTSGGGFALMTEGVSLSGMLETPVVLVVAQRPGPATGLPTRTEQADLNLVLYAGHGEFPRAILAPGSIGDCGLLAAKAARLAEDSQGPVFVLTDQYLADCTSPIKPFDLHGFETPVNPLETHRRHEAELKPGAYNRYDHRVRDGRSPKLLPGFSDHLVKLDSDEHTPDGHITEDLDWRVKMQDKRMKKLHWLRERTIAPAYHGDEQADLILVGWGSSLGAGLDTLAELKREGRKAGFLHFNQLYPLDPSDWLPRLEKAGRVVFFEGNYDGQFAQLVRRECCFQPHMVITRYDGLPLTASYILERLEANHGVQ
ncbi:2-oxoacid:acceptor oxidoreductase subunit alpha [Deltaproteobacteria bacterium Smac51]|nr:2-oxoacid:acceptor oxidoreductase subunit alpha [Deltaproteobacteria bacterium Smac51]